MPRFIIKGPTGRPRDTNTGMQYEKVLVTGGSGFLGRHVVDELGDACEVGVLDIKPPRQSVRYHEASIVDLDAVAAAVAGYDAVIHLAGIDDGNPFSDHDYFQTNVQGAWNVLHACEQAGIHQVAVASSTATLGLGWDRGPEYLPVDVDHPLHPTETYGLTKQLIETISTHFVRRGELRVVCLRPTLIIRPEREAAFVAQLALPDPDRGTVESLEPSETTATGGLSATRTYVRSRDAARCFVAALDYRATRYGVFLVSARDNIGRVRTLERMRDVYGRVPEVRDPALYEADPLASALDIRSTVEQLGWEPEGTWEDVGTTT